MTRVAIITAGGSGMGAAAARKLSGDGYEVAILSSSGKGEALAEELGGIGVTGSNQSNEDLQQLVDRTLQRLHLTLYLIICSIQTLRQALFICGLTIRLKLSLQVERCFRFRGQLSPSIA